MEEKKLVNQFFNHPIRVAIVCFIVVFQNKLQGSLKQILTPFSLVLIDLAANVQPKQHKKSHPYNNGRKTLKKRGHWCGGTARPLNQSPLVLHNYYNFLLSSEMTCWRRVSRFISSSHYSTAAEFTVSSRR